MMKASPMAERRFNEQQIGEILRRAGEIQVDISPDAEAHGVTLAELQKIASEIGIEPHVLERAAQEVESGTPVGKDAERPNFRMFDHTVDGELTDEQWDEVVMLLRQSTGLPGTSTLQGNMREWSGNWDLGHVTLTASSRNRQTRFRMLADTTGGTVLGWILSSTFGLLITLIVCAVLGKMGLSMPTVPIVGVLTAGTVFASTFAWIRSWQRKSHKRLASLFSSVISGVKAIPVESPVVETATTKAEETAVQRITVD